MTKINLTKSEEKALNDSLLRFNVDLITRKARVILFLAHGGRVTEAERAFGISRYAIYQYIKQFKSEGVEGILKIKPITGRPSRLPEDIEKIIVDALKRSPASIEEINTAAHNWTLELMRDYLEAVHNITICISYMWLLMHKYGVRNIYSRAIMTSPDPQYKEKAEVVETLKKTWKQARSKKANVFSLKTR
jgi:transposase